MKTKSIIFTAITAAAIIFVTFCPAWEIEKESLVDKSETKTNSTVQDFIVPEIDERIELVCIVFRLAGAREYRCKQFTKYNDDINNYFVEFKNHDAVLLARSLHTSSLGGINIAHDRVVFLGTCLEIKDGHLILSEQKIKDINNFMKENGMYNYLDKQAVKRFTELLDDFYVKSRFHQFFETQQEMYHFAQKQFLAGFRLIDLQWFDSFYGTEKNENIHLVLTMANEDGGYSFKAPMKNGQYELHAMIGVGGTDDQGQPLFTADDYRSFMFQYNMLLFAGPIIEKHFESLKPEAEKLCSLMGTKIAQATHTKQWPETMMTYYLSYAVLIKYFKSHENIEISDRLLQFYQKNGFVWLDRFVEALDRYEKERNQFPTLDHYMPEIAELQKSIVTRSFLRELRK
ncbi:MAG: DUF4932 domain-containing protein [Planctomycetaceae bacterium]|jgi:hypothetical protein|nr:DUF4932 domain-containing protein [Planctomycetaceae bacterium]